MRNFINITSGFLPPIITALIGLILTPLIISKLGIEAYSYWPLCNSLILYIGFISLPVTAGVRRQTVYAIDRGDVKKAREYFSTGLCMVLVLWLCLVAGGVLFSPMLHRIVDIDPGLIHDVKFMFLCILFSASIEILSYIFFIGSYARDKIYIEKIARMFSPAIRLSIIFGAFAVWQPSLKILGVATVVTASLILVISVSSFKICLPQIEINPSKYISRDALFILTGFAGWVLIAAIGAYSFRILPLILANRLAGASAAGNYGVVLQVLSLFSAMVMHLGYVISRKMLQSVSNNDFKEAESVLRRYYFFVVIFLALPVGFLYTHAHTLFYLWIGDQGNEIASLFQVAVLIAFVTEPLGLINSLLISSKRLVTNGVISLLMGLTMLGIVFLLGFEGKNIIIGIIISAGLALFIRNIALAIDAKLTCHLNSKAMFINFLQGAIVLGCIIAYGSYRPGFKEFTSVGLEIGFDAFMCTIIWSLILLVVSKDARTFIVRRVVSNF